MSNWTFRTHTTASGQKIYYARSRQPVRNPKTGKVTHKPVERSSRTSSIQEARELTREFDKEYHEAAYNSKEEAARIEDVFTFADAVGVYVKSGNPGAYLDRLLPIIGLKAAKDIDQEDCLEVVARLYPNCKASTTNRQVWTPISAVLRFCDLHPALKRPKGHDRQPTIDRTSIPPDGWYSAVLPHLSLTRRALMLLISLHGLRISEAIERKPSDLDLRRGTLTLPNTKDGKPYTIRLADPVLDAIKAMLAERKRVNLDRAAKGKSAIAPKWLFGTCQRSNISRDFRKACEKAGVPTFGTHRIGRHSFATRILEDGKSLPYLKKAGRWSTLKAVERYSHLAKSEVDDEVKEMAKRWHEGREAVEIVPISSKRKAK
jgi:integrase